MEKVRKNAITDNRGDAFVVNRNIIEAKKLIKKLKQEHVEIEKHRNSLAESNKNIVFTSESQTLRNCEVRNAFNFLKEHNQNKLRELYEEE